MSECELNDPQREEVYEIAEEAAKHLFGKEIAQMKLMLTDVESNLGELEELTDHQAEKVSEIAKVVVKHVFGKREAGMKKEIESLKAEIASIPRGPWSSPLHSCSCSCGQSDVSVPT